MNFYIILILLRGGNIINSFNIINYILHYKEDFIFNNILNELVNIVIN
jgi:hypothetical protein